MINIESLIHRVQQTQHGFKDIQKAADEVVAEHPENDCLRLAKELYDSRIYQARCLAVFIWGRFAATSEDVLDFLRRQVSQDDSWQVQENLAKAFDQYCADFGYEKALPTIKEWLADDRANVRRAVTEGLRIWTGRPYFKTHPEVAVQMLSQLREDESEYVRKSVGNALRDISKKHPDLVAEELSKWEISNKQIKLTYKLASRFLEKRKEK